MFTPFWQVCYGTITINLLQMYLMSTACIWKTTMNNVFLNFKPRLWALSKFTERKSKLPAGLSEGMFLSAVMSNEVVAGMHWNTWTPTFILCNKLWHFVKLRALSMFKINSEWHFTLNEFKSFQWNVSSLIVYTFILFFSVAKCIRNKTIYHSTGLFYIQIILFN